MEKEWLVLGEDCYYSTDCGETGLNNNVLVVGGSGSGKTWSIAEPRLLETKISSVIVTCTKRRIVDLYAPLLARRGYKVIILDFTKPEHNHFAYDPLAYVESEEDIAALARAIVMADPRKSQSHADPYWDDAAVSLLSAEIACVLTEHVLYNNNAPCPTFDAVLELHDTLQIQEGNATFPRRGGDAIVTTLDDRFARLDPKSFAVRCWNTFRMLPIRTAGCVYSSLNTVLDTLFTSGVRHMMRMSWGLDLARIGQEKTALFVATSPVNASLQSLINLFYSQAIRALFEYAEAQPDGVLPVPVHMICDDFATGGRIESFPEYISIFREKGISATLLLQSESQLVQMYGPENATTIINNCDSYIFMGSMDLRTAQSVSMRANLPLEDILYMPVGSEIIFRRGQKPIQGQRYDIQADDRYQSVLEIYESQVQARKNKTNILKD